MDVHAALRLAWRRRAASWSVTASVKFPDERMRIIGAHDLDTDEYVFGGAWWAQRLCRRSIPPEQPLGAICTEKRASVVIAPSATAAYWLRDLCWTPPPCGFATELQPTTEFAQLPSAMSLRRRSFR